jgi:hypothetical protein
VIKSLSNRDLNVWQPQAFDKIGRAHEGAVWAPVWRGFINDESALVPRQVEVQLEGHRQLDVVDPAHLKNLSGLKEIFNQQSQKARSFYKLYGKGLALWNKLEIRYRPDMAKLRPAKQFLRILRHHFVKKYLE